MKAKVKDTGEIVDVMFIIHPNPDVKPYWCAVNGKGNVVDYYNESEIELIDTQETPINWEQRRYKLAKDAMNSILTAPIIDGVNPNPSAEDVATYSVRLADALIKELKGGKE